MLALHFVRIFLHLEQPLHLLLQLLKLIGRLRAEARCPRCQRQNENHHSSLFIFLHTVIFRHPLKTGRHK
jgi:hypothetical protein